MDGRKSRKDQERRARHDPNEEAEKGGGRGATRIRKHAVEGRAQSSRKKTRHRGLRLQR